MLARMNKGSKEERRGATTKEERSHGLKLLREKEEFE